MTAKSKTVPADGEAARQRLRSARAYIEVAELVLGERDRAELQQ